MDLPTRRLPDNEDLRCWIQLDDRAGAQWQVCSAKPTTANFVEQPREVRVVKPNIVVVDGPLARTMLQVPMVRGNGGTDSTCRPSSTSRELSQRVVPGTEFVNGGRLSVGSVATTSTGAGLRSEIHRSHSSRTNPGWHLAAGSLGQVDRSSSPTSGDRKSCVGRSSRSHATIGTSGASIRRICRFSSLGDSRPWLHGHLMALSGFRVDPARNQGSSR